MIPPQYAGDPQSKIRYLTRAGEILEKRLYEPPQPLTNDQVQFLQDEIDKIEEQIDKIEEQLAELYEQQSRPGDRQRKTERRRGSTQESVTGTMRENLGKGDHRTTTTTRTTTTVRKGRRPIVQRNSQSVSAPLGDNDEEEEEEEEEEDQRGKGKRNINALIEHLRKKYKRRQDYQKKKKHESLRR